MLRRLSKLTHVLSLLLFVQGAVHAHGQTKRPASSSNSQQEEPPKSLASFKARFLNKQVIIKDVPFIQRYCLEWNHARRLPNGTYAAVDGLDAHLPINFSGRRAQVIAIQLAPSFLQATKVGTPNAFGEAADETTIPNPYMDVFVMFRDGTLGTVRGYTITLVPEKFVLADEADNQRKAIESSLDDIIGRKLYAVGYSVLYSPTASLEDISGPNEILSRLTLSDVPFLQPLIITKAKYIPDPGAVIFKLRLPSGSEAIAYTAPQFIHLEGHNQDVLPQICGLLLAAIPTGLTPREIKSIQNVSIFRGMSESALDYALGFKESENDWGNGGKQRIYYHGKLLVYVDSKGKVTDWQNLD